MPSGATLKINPPPFDVSKTLYQAVLKEGKGVEFSTKDDLEIVFKNLFCTLFSSPEIERCLRECFKYCIYNYGQGDLKIDQDSFEPVANREDYFSVCVEVAIDNIGPFTKSLSVVFQKILSIIGNIQK